MRRLRATFLSEGLRLDGDVWLPGGLRRGETRPALVACSGFLGLKDIHPARFARAFVPLGYICLAFDYRGFGSSEGEADRLIPQEQIEDVRAAVTFLRTVRHVDPERIALLGWGLGGGVAVAAAADDPWVRAVAAVNAVGDGERSTRALHDGDSWRELLERVAADRARRVVEGTSALVDPFSVVRLDEATREYVEKELVPQPGFGTYVTLAAIEYLLRFRPERVADRIAPRPLLLVHGSENRLYAPREARELFRRAGEPKELVFLEGGGHTDWMYDDHPTFARLVATVRGFLAASLERDTVRRASA